MIEDISGTRSTMTHYIASWLVSSVAPAAAGLAGLRHATKAPTCCSNPNVVHWLTAYILAAAAAISSIPMFIALNSRSLAACWLTQAATLALAGAAAGMLPAMCCSLYPAGVRISGVCLGFHAGAIVRAVCMPRRS